MERIADDQNSNERIHQAVDAETTDRGGKLSVDWLEQNKIEFAGPNELGEVHQVGKEKCIKDLADDLVRSHQQYHIPFRPITDGVYLTINDLDEDELPSEPECFDQHPQQEVKLKVQLPDQGVAQHYSVNAQVTCELIHLPRIDSGMRLPSASPARTVLPAGHFERNDITIICETVDFRGRASGQRGAIRRSRRCQNEQEVPWPRSPNPELNGSAEILKSVHTSIDDIETGRITETNRAIVAKGNSGNDDDICFAQEPIRKIL